MKVLVTNDDGVKAEGIKILVEKIKQYEKLRKGLMQQLLTGKVKVNV